MKALDLNLATTLNMKKHCKVENNKTSARVSKHPFITLTPH